MEVTKEKQGNVLIVSVSGKVEPATSKAFEDQILPDISAGESQILVDCSQLAYISSAGLRIFLMAAKKLKAGKGKLVVCSLQETTKPVFRISGFYKILTIKETREEALQAFDA